MKRQIITAIATVSLFGLFASPALAAKGPVKSNKPARDHVRVAKSVGAGGAHLSMLGNKKSDSNKTAGKHKNAR